MKRRPAAPKIGCRPSLAGLAMGHGERANPAHPHHRRRLAGSEAAWQIVTRGVPVVMHEMRPTAGEPTRTRPTALAELVCSNSFRSDDKDNAIGLLHEEMRRLELPGDARRRRQPGAGRRCAGGRSRRLLGGDDHALQTIRSIEIRREEIALPPAEWDQVIVATGPLTSPPLAQAIRSLTGEEALAFFDAIAPIVHRDSIDLSIAWFQSRYDKKGPGGSGADYINCPLTRAQYDGFIDALLAGDKTAFHEWEASTPYFDGCLPIEVMAERGRGNAAPRPDEAIRSHQSARPR